MRIGYSSISGSYLGIWVAHDAGYFAKGKLDDQIVVIPSGSQLAQVVTAGEIDVAALNGSSAMAAALQGDLISSSGVSAPRFTVSAAAETLEADLHGAGRPTRVAQSNCSRSGRAHH